ncbi:uncharacterized protein LOC115874949 [Sitophilus oryzae]|uniref:Uncharacterized protein LOC115874949 n=1 Tax=Sitophilus oryzae TaxID=7048 RepID=A0A6J2X4M2_SITOR|nr:uncharacterized protein LOC115874949 [Sitophilus oryzae]
MESLVKNEFQLYSNLAKPLILNLPTPKDRILAAAWVKKCADDKTGSEQLRTTYLKMLLFCLQRRRLTGLFADDPDKYEELEELPLGYDLNELAKNIIEQELDERRDKAMREISGDTEVSVCYSTDCSPDLTEYVAAQDIPHFGVHVYYALSSKPINKWNRSEKAILPKGTRSAIETSITQGATGGSASEPSCVCTPRGAKVKSDEPSGEGEEESNLPECQRTDKEYDSRTMKKKKRPKRMGQSPPTHPIGEVHRVPEERVTPTWGTNLLDVREPTDIGKIETPTEEEIKLEEEVSRLLEAEEDQDEDESDGGDEFKESTQDMLHIIDEWKQQKMDKPKRPSRLDKLGSKTGIKKPSSIKKPKIPVKGMKQPKLKRAMGKKPDNLPEEFAGWTEEELEEAGLTWADLMPIEDNVDDVLKEIEDQVMAQEDDQLFEGSPNIHIPYEPTDYDEMIREAEKDLLNSKTVYEIGAEEDQDIVDHYDDQMDDFGDEFNIYQAAEEMRVGSPAIQSRIPVTTPGRTPTPNRVRSSERIFAEEGDFVFKRRTSPFAPIQPPPKETQSRPLQHSFENEDFGERDPVMVQIFEEAKSAVQSIDQPQDQSSGSANVSTAERSRQQADFRGKPGSSQPERAPLGSPELDSLHFESKFRRQQGGLFDRSPVPESASPPQLSDDESFRMYESFYREQDSSPSERSTSARATSTPPAAAAEQDSRLQRAQLEIKAWEQETKLRQGSPEARRIIDEAQGQLMLGAPGVNEEAPFPTQKPQRVLPKPAFSPTTGSPLNVPSYDIQPDDLGVNYDDVLDIPPTPFPPCGYSSPPAAQRDDLFTRLGAPEITTDDFRPRPPQYFHPGLDIAADDSPPPPLCMEEQICESASGGGYVRPPRPVSDLSPVREKYFDEEVYKFFEETEHKGQRVDARPMSPWRNESIYYTPEVDRTLSVEYPLDSPPPRPFVPGVSSPVTPPCQLPIQRPGGYDTPHDYGAQFDMLPDHYPPDQRTPIEPRPIPGMSEFDRAPCRGAVKDSWRKVASPRGRRRHLGAAGTFNSAGEDQYEDFQTPRRNLSQCRARLFPTPEGEAGPSRRPTGSTPPFYNSDFESPPPAPVPVQRFPAAKRIKKRGKYPEPEPPVSDIPHFSLPWEDGIQEQQNPPDYDDVRFRAKYRFCNDNLFDSPPALEPGSPLQGSGLQDTFEMYESFYRDQDSGSGRSTPTRGACQESCTPPPPDRDQQLKRAQLELKAWEQEMNLRQGSPEAAGPAGIPTVMDEQAPFSTQRPQRMPPKPAFSPTTGSQLPVPDYDIQPDDLGVSYDEGLDFRSFSPCRPGGSSSPQAAEQGDLFTRLGAPEITTDDNRPPQYFHPGLDIATDESPPPPLYFSDYEVSSFEERVRPPRSSCLSPVRETQYDEEIYRSFEDVEYKGKHVDVRPMSPWRNESIYYTPETDRTLSLDSSAPTQFIPGVTSPATPPCQFPVQRPDSFATPDYGDGILDVTPPPFNVFDEYSPCQEGAGARQRSPVLSPLSTPEGVAGPSNRRRRFYNSDFESPPTPSPPRVQRFPVAQKIKKRGRYPPEQELPLPDIPQFGLQWENELRAQQQQQINENLGDPAFVSRFEDEQYSFNETPPDLQQYDNLVGQVSPCIPRTPTAPPITPSSYPPIRTPPSVPSGSPRTPPLPRAPPQVEAPCVATRGTGSRRIPVPRAKPDIYTTRSQVLRMKKMEQQRDATQKISPVSKRLQENRARLARIDEDRKLAAARRQQQPSQRRSIPRLRDASSRTRAAPCQLPQGTTRPRPVPTSGLRPPAAGRPSGIRPPAAGRSSGEPPSPYSEEPAHLSFAAQGQVCPGAGAPSIHDADEQELREFEQLEREMVAEGQGQVCPGATALPDDAPDQSDLRRRLFEQQMAIQGPPRTGLQYPAEGITYSPQRPMETFGHIPPRPTRPPSPCAVPYSPSQEEMAPKSLRKHIKATADARFHPGQRRDLSREDRRVMRGPPLSMHNIPERPN